MNMPAPSNRTPNAEENIAYPVYFATNRVRLRKRDLGRGSVGICGREDFDGGVTSVARSRIGLRTSGRMPVPPSPSLSTPMPASE